MSWQVSDRTGQEPNQIGNLLPINGQMNLGKWFARAGAPRRRQKSKPPDEYGKGSQKVHLKFFSTSGSITLL